jgi:hypothetical protein
MKKTKLICSVILLVSCTINAADTEGKKTKKNVLSKKPAKSKSGKVTQQKQASSVTESHRGQEEAELAEALKRSQNPYDIDPDMAKAIAASIAESSSQQSASGGQAAQSPREMSEEEQLEAALLASQNPYDIDPDMARAIEASKADFAAQPAFTTAGQAAEQLDDKTLRQIAAQEQADQEDELQRENLARQGRFFQELSAPEILEVDGKNYIIRQIFALRQSKVSGRFELGKPDDTCFAQATKNSKAIVEANHQGSKELLAPLVILEDARQALQIINGKLLNSGNPADDGDFQTRHDDSDGNWDNVSVEFGSKMIDENWELRRNLVVISDQGLQALVRPKSQEEKDEELAQLRENGGKNFFVRNQVSSNTLDVINSRRRREIENIGIILRKGSHYIAIVFNQRDPQNIEVLVADSIKGSYVNDREMTRDIYLPLIQLLQKTDLTDWLKALQEVRQVEDDQGPAFSLFD